MTLAKKRRVYVRGFSQWLPPTSHFCVCNRRKICDASVVGWKKRGQEMRPGVSPDRCIFSSCAVSLACWYTKRFSFMKARAAHRRNMLALLSASHSPTLSLDDRPQQTYKNRSVYYFRDHIRGKVSFYTVNRRNLCRDCWNWWLQRIKEFLGLPNN